MGYYVAAPPLNLDMRLKLCAVVVELVDRWIAPVIHGHNHIQSSVAGDVVK